MSLPPELRVLCHQLSSISPEALLNLTPTLLNYISRCRVPFSSPVSTAKSDSSSSAVLVHKVKTHISSLINGRSVPGRFAAVVLIQGIIDVGGWETLRGSEPWVRALLSILGKPDPVVSKELCIVTLTKIYSMTHEYQTLVREITTPTLPAFITACLNLIKPSASKSPTGVPESLKRIVFSSFSILLPRHTTIYRPFTAEIRQIAGSHIVATDSTDPPVEQSLKKSARKLYVVLHQTTPKNAGGEEWGKAVRELIKSIHLTADQVFRAVVEDWESTTGYISSVVDLGREPHGGATATNQLPEWTGIGAGLERLSDLLELLQEYLSIETSMPVSVPLGVILDMVNRMVAIALSPFSPSQSDGAQHMDAARLNPSIDRDERDQLWSGLPQIYTSGLRIIIILSERLEQDFVTLAPSCLNQIAWVFQSGRHSPDFRLVAYQLMARVLERIGPNLDKQVINLASIIRSCCEDIEYGGVNFKHDALGSRNQEATDRRLNGNGATTQNADALLQSKTASITYSMIAREPRVAAAASDLLPLFLSHCPQNFLDMSLRILVERTAILSHNKSAMLASILNPFYNKNGKAMASILPHLARDFGDDAAVEALLRPRMPLLPGRGAWSQDVLDGSHDDEYNDVAPDMDTVMEAEVLSDVHEPSAASTSPTGVMKSQPGIGNSETLKLSPVGAPLNSADGLEGFRSATAKLQNYTRDQPASISTPVMNVGAPAADTSNDMDVGDSDNDSVHLTMQLDSDSEDE